MYNCTYDYAIHYIHVAEADQILENEQNLLRLPGGPLNFESIDAARKKSK